MSTCKALCDSDRGPARAIGVVVATLALLLAFVAGCQHQSSASRRADTAPQAAPARDKPVTVATVSANSAGSHQATGTAETNAAATPPNAATAAASEPSAAISTQPPQAASSTSGEGATAPQPSAQQPSPPTGNATAYWAGSGQRQDKASWRKLAKDGLHDLSNPGLQYLQNPREALSGLPAGKSGNFVDWVQALNTGAIQPRARLHGGGTMELLDLDVILTDTKNMPTVTFAHKTHTQWLGCKQCHEQPFVSQKGANNMIMADIFAGKFCGKCHGRVSFPLTQCFDCHDGARPGQASISTEP